MVKPDTATKTADYTILDSDNLRNILVDSRAGDVVITLPTLADNLEREIFIKVPYVGGKITVDGEGAETIDGETSIFLQGQHDFILVKATTAEWIVLSIRQTYNTGWINCSDWTNRHLGSATVNYNNLSGTFTVGEEIEEATSGNTGVIQSDTGSVLILKNVTGTGVFTNGRTLTGATSGATW